MLGHDVEAVEDRGRRARPFIVARVVSAEPHPNADRLRVCVVDTGDGQVQVVCGAPNARAGMKGVFAPAGDGHPAHRRGAEGKHDPRRRLARHADVGRRAGARRRSRRHHRIAAETRRSARKYADLLGLGDPVIDIKVTPNRADCLGVRGIARDLAAVRPRHAEAARHDPGAGPVPLADRHQDRRTVPPARCSSAAISAACKTGRARIGCSAGWKRSGCGRSRPWSTSPIS